MIVVSRVGQVASRLDLIFDDFFCVTPFSSVSSSDRDSRFRGKSQPVNVVGLE